MRVEASYSFRADLQTVWAALQSPEVLSGCIPGCQTFEPAGEDTYDVVLRVGVAAITGTYTGRVTVSDRTPLDSYRMVVEGRGPAGAVRGEGLLSFSDTVDGTEVRVVGDTQVSGVLARVGQRLLGSTSKMLMNQFFGCLKSRIEAGGAVQDA